MRKIVLSLLLILAPLSSASVAAKRRAVNPARPSIGISVSVLAAPQAFTGHDQQQMAWELLINNERNEDITLQSLEVFSPSSGATLGSYDTNALRTIIQNLPPRAGSNPPPERIRANESAVVYLWLTQPDLASVPAVLNQRLAITSAPRGTETVTGGLTHVSTQPPTILSAPLNDGPWFALNGPANDSPHRRAIIRPADEFRVPQRLAIDWLMIDDNGRTYSGDPSKNSSYYAFGREALAVADGTIAFMKDGIPENVPMQPPVVEITLDTLAGNYIAVDIGRGEYAIYAHLQPGSMRVNVGDRVKRGAPLALLGNTGNSTQPHLHFHVCDAPSPYDCNGLPYVLDQYLTLDGVKRLQLPMNFDLVAFGQ